MEFVKDTCTVGVYTVTNENFEMNPGQKLLENLSLSACVPRRVGSVYARVYFNP